MYPLNIIVSIQYTLINVSVDYYGNIFEKVFKNLLFENFFFFFFLSMLKDFFFSQGEERLFPFARRMTLMKRRWML